MQLSNKPAKITLPFANAGGKNTIPVASQIGIVDGAASYTDGFPPLTRTQLAAGGKPPSGLDMNGALFPVTALARWAAAGGGYPYDATFATDTNVGGYPQGARVLRSDGTGYWLNTTDNNITDPESAGAVAAGWVPDFTSGAAAVTMTNANVTLTNLQYGKPLIVITGALTANLNLIFPTIVGEWIVINSATGAFAITAKTAAGTGVALISGPQIVVGDGTNIVTPGVAVAPGSLLATTYVTANGTYTKATNNPSYITVEVWGGGGGGGGNSSGGMNAGGGGAGGYSFRRIAASALAASETLTIGAAGAAGTNTGGNGGKGGTTSFGTWLTGIGGDGGVGTTTTAAAAGGQGGLGTNGDLNLRGNAGASSFGVTSQVATYAAGGMGGGTTLGGAPTAPAGTTASGNPATANSGAGGSGGCGNSVTGGAGGTGFIIIREYK